MHWLDIFDLVLAPIYLGVILLIAYLHKQRMIEKYPYYKYYIPGLLAKIGGGIAVCLIYVYYYGGGDTVNYFHDNAVMVNLLLKEPGAFFQVLFSKNSPETYSLFDNKTDWPWYWYDGNTFFVVRLTCLLTLISSKSFIVTTILLALISFTGIWKLYHILVNEFPTLKKQLAIALLFIPSVVFWGSGLLKDTIILSSLCWLFHALYQLIVNKNRLIPNLIILIISSLVIFSIRAFILIILIPAVSFWLIGVYSRTVKGIFIKGLIVPILLVIFLGSGYLFLSNIDHLMGIYSLDNVIEHAAVVQYDLKQEYYQGASYDIGSFEPTLLGIIKKMPLAINAALFRPYLWEATNPVMILSGLENAYIMLLTIYILIKVRIFGVLAYIRKHPFLLFGVTFSILFAFSVGLTTANFGALVRYKIPAILFYVACLFIILQLHRQGKIKKHTDFSAGDLSTINEA